MTLATKTQPWYIITSKKKLEKNRKRKKLLLSIATSLS